MMLNCPKCGRHYHVGVDATIITTEGALGLAKNVVMTSGGGSGTSEDMVATLEGTVPDRWAPAIQTARERVAFVRRALESGQSRVWYCRACGHESTRYSYPA